GPSHKSRNLLLVTGIAVGIFLFNPMTGSDARKWLKETVFGDEDDFGYQGNSGSYQEPPSAAGAGAVDRHEAGAFACVQPGEEGALERGRIEAVRLGDIRGLEQDRSRLGGDADDARQVAGHLRQVEVLLLLPGEQVRRGVNG